MSRYTPPSSKTDADEGVLESMAPMRRSRPVVFWVVIIGVLAMVASTIGAFIQVLLT